jgi:hypothetical protein
MFHIHQWKAQAVSHRNQPMIDPTGFQIMEGVISPRTDVLYVCQKCGKATAKTLLGKWDAKDFQIEASR